MRQKFSVAVAGVTMNIVCDETQQTIDAAVADIARETGNIILIGMPGSGKSTVGKALAKALGRPFVDTDALITEAAGRAIPDIFAMFNRSQQDGDSARAMKEYRALGERNQSGCIECGACAAACPQQINIPEELKKLHKRWGA